MSYRRLWIGLFTVIACSFAVLIYFGREIYIEAPPTPTQVVAQNGAVVFTRADIKNGQNVWQSIGGQEVGTVWGHGAYVAPDWSADWLHRECIALLNRWATDDGAPAYNTLTPEKQAALRERLKLTIRANTYNPTTKVLTVSDDEAWAMKQTAHHYEKLFGDDPALNGLRKDYAIPSNSIKTAARRRQICAFFFWAAWSCSTDRPGQSITYTNNWPAESLIGNRPTASMVIWSVISIVVLLAGIGALAWHYLALRSREEPAPAAPDSDPLLRVKMTPSMSATLKYFWTVVALICLQVLMGIITAHYGVEGNSFYGIPLDRWLPYAVTRTWHLQLGIFWIATAWLATGLFIAPAVSGHEPKYQAVGVNLLFCALLVIVGGSMAGQWLGVEQRLGNTANFWFGHQGYEYVDLGRFWQIFLFAGLIIWLGLMLSALWPALKSPSEHRSLLSLFTLSCVAIAGFYGAGLAWGQHTNLSVEEYWRWWVVHLWVEGFFEVFAVTVIAFLFVRMGLLRLATVTTSTLFATAVFLAGGIIGTMHHLYFTGTPTGVLALGASFSALEVVPLTLIGFEAIENLGLLKSASWVEAYRWPIMFFIAVSFWNLVGAGVFGFLINPPISLYYVQGLNTTPVHAHTALFGVYGMLGIGLMLFCLRSMTVRSTWNTKSLQIAFWCLNVGVGAMAVLSLLPIGLLQMQASISHGYWFARSAQFMQQPLLQTLRWMRVVGDVTFSAGVVALVYFIAGIKLGWSIQSETQRSEKGSHSSHPRGEAITS